MSNTVTVVKGSLSTNSPTITVFDFDTTMSWSRYAKGTATARITSNKVRKWIDLSLEESYVSDKGKIVSKKTMMSISPEAAKEVYEMLKSVFES